MHNNIEQLYNNDLCVPGPESMNGLLQQLVDLMRLGKGERQCAGGGLTNFVMFKTNILLLSSLCSRSTTQTNNARMQMANDGNKLEYYCIIANVQQQQLLLFRK